MYIILIYKMLEFSVSRQHNPLDQVDRSKRSDRFALKDIDRLPTSVSIVEGNTYVIASWDSNTYIKAGADNTFTIIDQYGDVLRTNKEYVLINPEY